MHSSAGVGVACILLRPLMMLSFMLLMSCAPKVEPPPPLPPAPILPSPDGKLYATGQSDPRDPLVAQVVSGGLPWQESLSGAATALALEQPFAPELSSAKWAAVRAGYPHPIRTMLVASVTQDDVPDALISELQRAVSAGDDIGLVRARAGGSDRWVALLGRPSVHLSPFPRELALGEALVLESDGDLTYRLLSPSNILSTGRLPAEPRLSESGEWWLELRRREQPVLSIPLHVDMQTPPAPILTLPGAESARPSDAVALAYELLSEIRGAFEVAGLATDPTLETLASYPLQQALEGTWEQEAGESRLRGAGFVGGPVGQLTCTGRTVAVCLDTLLWSLDDRAVLLDPGLRVVGAAAQVSTEGITMVLNAASE